MALDPAFVADAPYGPDGLLMDELVQIDVDASRVVGRMPTSAELPLTRAQRAHETRHPRHVSGGLMVHMTGMVAFAHAYYVFGLRHHEGWTGYGARIHSARFLSLAPPGEPLLLDCTCIQHRRGDDRLLARYRFEFTQGETPVYRSEQTAMWMKVPPDGPVIS